MPRITSKLIKSKSEHNDGIMGDLEEISLHQLEIEKIEVIGDECRKLKILYLQNNIISKLENLVHLKDLNYLNLALNNIAKIEGLESCEFLSKLDLTVNFVDLDTFEESITNLTANKHLKELFLTGCPCGDWEGYRDVVVVLLPQLVSLDGKEITRSERIRSKQRFDKHIEALRLIAPVRAEENRRKRAERAAKRAASGPGDDETCEHAPEVRTEMYREMAEEKEKEEEKKRANQPKKREAEKEHDDKIKDIRAKELASSKILQCNQGKWEFTLREDEFNNILLELMLSRHLSTSLIDVDVQPTYVSIIIKNKVFRLEWPEEINPSKSKAERSKTTGSLLIVAPKVVAGRVKALKEDVPKKEVAEKLDAEGRKGVTSTKLGDQILAAAVDFRHIAKKKAPSAHIRAIRETKVEELDDEGKPIATFIDDADVPPLE